MRTHTLVSVIALSLLTGGAGGYLVRALNPDGSLVLSLNDATREEYLASQDSFSRVRNTKNALDALSLRVGGGLMDGILAYNRLPKSTDSEERKADQVLERTIQAGEEAFKEFEGTRQQVEIALALLEALQQARRFDRWTQVYLEALYANPTHPLVSRLANEAVKISKLVGQQERVVQALGYLSVFPGEFAGRARIESALDSAKACFGHSEVLPESAEAGGLGRCDLLEQIPCHFSTRSLQTEEEPKRVL